MIEHMGVLIYQMKIIATLMAIGFLEQRLKLVDDKLIDSLSAIIAKLILPFMILTIVGSIQRSELINGIRLFIATLVCYTLSILLTKFFARFSSLEEPTRSMHVLLQCYGNSGYIGIPLITSIFSLEAGIVAAAFTTADSFFYWVVGPTIAGGKKFSFKKLVSPITLSIAAGLLIVLLNMNFNNNIVWDTMKNVGGTCKYFASIYIGMRIGRMNLRRLKDNFHSATASITKLVLIPVAAYVLFGKTGFLEGNRLIMFIILCATPSGMSLPIVADIAEINDKEYLSVGITISTVLCLISIPLIIWFISVL